MNTSSVTNSPGSSFGGLRPTPFLKGILCAIVLMVILAFCYGISKTNEEIRLRNLITQQIRKTKLIHDNTFKVISQTAQVSERYKGTFEKVYPELMKGRYGNTKEGALALIVQESNPTFDTSLYNKLVDKIEEQRAKLVVEENFANSLKAQHDNLLQTRPSRYFLSGIKPIDVPNITSDVTEEAFKTGRDNNIDLFKE